MRGVLTLRPIKAQLWFLIFWKQIFFNPIRWALIQVGNNRRTYTTGGEIQFTCCVQTTRYSCSSKSVCKIHLMMGIILTIFFFFMVLRIFLRYGFSTFCDHRLYRCVCVPHVKPFLLPVDIQHTQCPCRFFLLERYKVCGHKQSITIRVLILVIYFGDTYIINNHR